jgi:hypothetical protein
VQNSYKEIGVDGKNGVSAVTTVLGLPSEALIAAVRGRLRGGGLAKCLLHCRHRRTD